MHTNPIYMRRALELAEKGKGHTGTNPMVGAVLVPQDRILSEGWHARYGGAHAEADCLNKLRDEDRHLLPESTMYVTLEPCAHFGKTPPCADRIIREKVGRVVICNSDPFSQVDGLGLQKLKDAGIETSLGLLGEEGRWLNRRFFCFQEKKRPYIILKWAQSADSYLAPADRKRTALSGPLAQQLVHRWRTEEAAIMVGYQTALHDDPQLTSRLHPGLQPLRIALDRNLQLPATARLFDGSAATWIVNEKNSGDVKNRTHIKLDFNESLLPGILQKLYEAGKNSLLVEGGAALLNSFITAGLWDEARILHTPVSLGGGIAAPLLVAATPAFQSSLGPDELRCWVHDNSGYPYAPGMAL